MRSDRMRGVRAMDGRAMAAVAMRARLRDRGATPGRVSTRQTIAGPTGRAVIGAVIGAAIGFVPTALRPTVPGQDLQGVQDHAMPPAHALHVARCHAMPATRRARRAAKASAPIVHGRIAPAPIGRGAMRPGSRLNPTRRASPGALGRHRPPIPTRPARRRPATGKASRNALPSCWPAPGSRPAGRSSG